MFQLDRILFPVDFSERCAAAAPHVMTAARNFNADVTLLHAVQLPPVWYGEIGGVEIEGAWDMKELMRTQQLILARYLAEEIPETGSVNRVVEPGEPGSVIADYARAHNIDLIMMPTHGYGPFRRLLLGSVTAKILHDAGCPVWTDVHEESPFGRATCNSVLCAVDLRAESVKAIQWAKSFAEHMNAELTLVHAIPALAGPVAPGETRFRSFLTDHARKYLEDLQGTAGSGARVIIGGGKIADTVRNAALQHEADIVVIGQGCLHETLGALRSNAYAIIRQSPCPVVRV